MWSLKFQTLSNKCVLFELALTHITLVILFSHELFLIIKSSVGLFLSPKSLNKEYINWYTRWRNWQSSPVPFFWRPFSSGKSSGESNNCWNFYVQSGLFPIFKQEAFASIQFCSYDFVSRSLHEYLQRVMRNGLVVICHHQMCFLTPFLLLF